jgi:hypothetical protein
MKRTILKLKHAEKPDLFIVVNGGIAEAYDVAQTFKVKKYVMKEAIPAKICIYKDTECAIIEKSLNTLVVLYEGKGIRTSYSLIKEIE